MVPSFAKEGESSPSWISIPPDLLLMPEVDNLSSIIDRVYDNFPGSYNDGAYLARRDIMCQKKAWRTMLTRLFC